jgi:hypothetical protein
MTDNTLNILGTEVQHDDSLGDDHIQHREIHVID